MAITQNVNPAMVREIIKTTLEDDAIEGGIQTATVVVQDRIPSGELSTGIIREITRYLAAHFVALQDETTRIAEEKIGEAAVKYTQMDMLGDTGGLVSTRWGRVAVSLDSTMSLSIGSGGGEDGGGGKRPRLYSV